MPNFIFIEYTLMELFRKTGNWQHFVNKRVWLFIHQTMCIKRVKKKKLLGRHKNDISLTICGGSEAEEDSEAAKQKGHTCFKYVWPFCYHYALKG